LITEEQYREAAEVVRAYKAQLLQEAAKIDKLLGHEVKLVDAELGNSRIRILNRLKWSDYVEGLGKDFEEVTLLDISKMTRRELMGIRNFGKVALLDLTEALNRSGLTLKK